MATKTSQQVSGMTQGSGGVMTEALAGGGSKTWTPVQSGVGTSAYRTDYTDGVNAPTDTTASKGTITAPTTVYSGNIQNNAIPDLNKKLTTYSNTGQKTDANGNVTYSNGTAVPPEKTYMYDTATGAKVPVPEGASVADYPNYSPAPIDGTTTANTEYDTVQKGITDQLNAIKAGTDPQTASMIDAIHQQFEVLRGQQTQANQNSQASLTQGLITGGAARYGRGTAVEGLINNTVSFGLSQIQELNAKEQTAIANAKQAQIDQNWNLMKTSLDHAEQIRKEKVEKAQKISDKLAEENEKKLKASQLAQTDASIAQLYEGGMTNAMDIQRELQKAGYTTTVKEVADSLAFMQENKSITDLKQTAVENGDVPPEILNKEYKNTSEAIAALAPYIRKGNNEVVKVGDNAYLIDKTTGKVVKSYMAPATGGGSAYNLTPNQRITQEQSLSTKLKANTSTSKELDRQYSIMKTAIDSVNKGGNLNAGTQAIIKTYNLILEPSSVVRETEYAMSADGQSLLDKMSGRLTQLESGGGGITKENLKEFGNMAKLFLENSKKSAAEEIVRTGKAVENYGLDINNVMTPSQKGIYEKEKQKMSDTDTVDYLLKAQGVGYDQVLNTLTSQRQPGEVMVLDRKTGQAGTIPAGEFDNNLYVKL